MSGLLALVLFEGVASLALAWADREPQGLSESSHCTYDPLLGWVQKKSTHVKDLYGPGLNLTTNERGLRREEEVNSTPPAGKERILCIGDSFTLGHGVDDQATFPAWLEALDPTLEALNMGQGGYGIDQCFLWYRRDAKDLECDIVLLSFIAPDFERALSGRFQGSYPKPKLRVEGDRLILPQEDLPKDWSKSSDSLGGFFENLALARLAKSLRWRTNSGGNTPQYDDAIETLGKAMLRELDALAKERGAKLALAHLPLRDRKSGGAQALLKWLRPFAEELEVPLFDLTQDFESYVPGEADALYLDDGHMNAVGNRRVAEILLREFAAVSWLR